MSWLIPRDNPYWNKNIGKALGFEQREKLLEIVRPKAEDWRNLTIVKPPTKPQSGSKGHGLAYDKQDVRTEDNNRKGKS